MIIRYPIHDNGDEFLLDTESLDLAQRAAWAAKMLGASGWKIELQANMYNHGVPDTNKPPGTVVFISCSVVFSGMPLDAATKGTYASEAKGILLYPEAMVAAIAAALNIKIDTSKLKFVDPDDIAVALKDWQVPGSPIGPPLSSWPGHFVFRFTSHHIGATVTGQSSGTQYRLVLLSSSPFSTFHAWKAL